ncbi:toxic anion resistance protein [Anoxybacterium hadale]|uniref:Toxic anion resistance protein n=1 Tax=Anoxybacterium hadale TaxID=3408580 RepID=A0ACD1AB63_9FIRM|nr:toxic anion resistance protein [Clostridiales bacterium]
MSDEMKDTMPTLTLDPFGENGIQPPSAVPAAFEDKQVQTVEEPALTPEEQKIVDDFASKIELSNSNIIIQYGSGAQKKIAEFSESALNNVRTKDLGEVGELLTNVVTELKNFDGEEEEKGFLGIFKRTSRKLSNLKTKYDKAEVNVTKICSILENHQIQLLKDIALLDKMYDMNKVYFKELSMYILAGKKKLNEVLNAELPKLKSKAQTSGLPEDAQAANDLAALCNRFEKKLHDLELTRMISIQMAPQIRLVQNNDTLMSDKIQSTLVNTIPLWKSQMVLALGIANSQSAAESQRQVTDMTNELLRKNAATLKMATIETAKESERGIVDIETLVNTNQSLISTLEEVSKIQEEGRQKRALAETELKRIEGELKQKLLEMRN